MEWHYLVVHVNTGPGGRSPEWILPPDPAEPSWLPPDPGTLRIEPGSSLHEGLAVLGRYGWELVDVTLAYAPMGSVYTLFFKKPG